MDIETLLELLLAWRADDAWWLVLLRILFVFFIAYLVHRLAARMADRFILLTRFADRRGRLREERLQTLRGLTSSLISALAFLVATIISLVILNVQLDTVVWVAGLFAAAFGFAARPLVSDVLTGVSFLFEDPYDVGEKVEIVSGVQGVVEAVHLRTTLLRAHTGELYSVPNGEVRLVRNFSRGRFSKADVTLKIASADLERALPLLETLGVEAVSMLPNLLEPWQIISQSGTMGNMAELTLLAKARFGEAAEMRPRLLALVRRRLEEAQIELVD